MRPYTGYTGSHGTLALIATFVRVARRRSRETVFRRAVSGAAAVFASLTLNHQWATAPRRSAPQAGQRLAHESRSPCLAIGL